MNHLFNALLAIFLLCEWSCENDLFNPISVSNDLENSLQENNLSFSTYEIAPYSKIEVFQNALSESPKALADSIINDLEESDTEIINLQ